MNLRPIDTLELVKKLRKCQTPEDVCQELQDYKIDGFTYFKLQVIARIRHFLRVHTIDDINILYDMQLGKIIYTFKRFPNDQLMLRRGLQLFLKEFPEDFKAEYARLTR